MSHFGGIDLGFRIPVVSDAVDDVTYAIGHNPIVDAIGDLAKTGVGQILLEAASGGAYGVLAGPFGPQLAGAVFAIPGMAKGDNFLQAWTHEFLRRVDELAKIISAGQAAGLSEAIGPAVDKLLANIPPDALEKITSAADSIRAAGGDAADVLGKIPGAGQAVADYAKMVPTMREDIAAYAKAKIYGIVPSTDWVVDVVTGRITTPVETSDSKLLGIPAYVPFPLPGSKGYLTSAFGPFAFGSQVTVTGAVPKSANFNPRIITTIGLLIVQNSNGSASVPVELISENPPPVYPQVGGMAYVQQPFGEFSQNERVIIVGFDGMFLAASHFVAVRGYNSSTKGASMPVSLLGASPVPIFPQAGSVAYLQSDYGNFVRGNRVAVMGQITVNGIPIFIVRAYDDAKKVGQVPRELLSTKIPSAVTTPKGLLPDNMVTGPRPTLTAIPGKVTTTETVLASLAGLGLGGWMVARILNRRSL